MKEHPICNFKQLLRWSFHKYVKRKFLFLILAACFTSCVNGPRLKNKASYLNGDNYKSSTVVSTAGIPLSGTTKAVYSIITGRLVSKGLASSSNVEVSLIKNGKAITTTQTKLNGSFTFKERLKNGTYKLKFKGRFETFELKSYKANLGEVIY